MKNFRKAIITLACTAAGITAWAQAPGTFCLNAVTVPSNGTSPVFTQSLGAGWLSFTANETEKTVEVHNMGGPGDFKIKKMQVAGGNCNGLVPLASDTLSDPDDSTLTTNLVGLVIGNTYYIRTTMQNYTDCPSCNSPGQAFFFTNIVNVPTVPGSTQSDPIVSNGGPIVIESQHPAGAQTWYAWNALTNVESVDINIVQQSGTWIVSSADIFVIAPDGQQVFTDHEVLHPNNFMSFHLHNINGNSVQLRVNSVQSGCSNCDPEGTIYFIQKQTPPPPIHLICKASGSFYTPVYDNSWSRNDYGDNSFLPSDNTCNDQRNGMIFLNTSSFNFQTARDARELRIFKNMPGTLSNNNWTLDFKFQLDNPPPNGALSNSPADELVTLSSSTQPLRLSCSGPVSSSYFNSCGSYPYTLTNAIWVKLMSPAPGACNDHTNVAQWYFEAHARGIISLSFPPAEIVSGPIPLLAGTNTYYIRLQRTTTGWGVLHVYSDPGFYYEIPNSPQCFVIPANVINLNCLSHGVGAEGDFKRVLNATISEVKIDNSVTCPTQLHPTFYVYGCGNPLILNGSASTASPVPISAHYWEATVCNSLGVPISPAVTYNGPWITGPPGIEPISTALPSVNISRYLFLLDPSGNPYCLRVTLHVQSCGNASASYTYPYQICCIPYRQMAPKDEGVDEINSIYPNPAGQEVYVKTSLENGKLEVYNLLGVKIYSSVLTSGENKIDVSSLASGTYFFKIMGPDGPLKIEKVIITGRD